MGLKGKQRVFEHVLSLNILEVVGFANHFANPFVKLKGLSFSNVLKKYRVSLT